VAVGWLDVAGGTVMEVTSRWGVFAIDDPEDYVLTGNEGVMLRLKFRAGVDVDATRIGFVQVVRTVIGGEGHAPQGVILARSIPSGEPDDGAHVDCAEHDRNPVYGLTLTGGGSDLTEGDFSPELGALGSHLFGGGVETTTAELADNPIVPLEEGACAQRLETAAFALAGHQKVRYYGSVRWGWARDGDGVATRDDFVLASRDGVTAMFRRCVELWNQAAATNPLRPLLLP
jgi:hypothetical protein